MVKKPEAWRGKFRVKPGPRIHDDEVRTERLAMRVHPDLMKIVDIRARENNQTRSGYIEKLLVGWIQADPRNPKVDSRGKLVDGAPTPLALMNENSMNFGRKFAKFADAYGVIMGTTPPSRWIEETKDFWLGED